MDYKISLPERLEKIEAVQKKVLENADILEIISSYDTQVMYQRENTFVCHCSFHEQKNPSVLIKTDEKTFQCIGCGAQGDVVDYVFYALAKKNEMLSKLSASEILAIQGKKKRESALTDKTKLQALRDEIVKVREAAYVELAAKVEMSNGEFLTAEEKYFLEFKKNRTFDIMNEAVKFYHTILCDEQQGGEASKYCKEKRGFTQTLIDSEQIGFSLPNSWAIVQKHLSNLGFDSREIEEAGLCKTRQISTKNGISWKTYDVFRDRIIIPIKNDDGNIIGLGGRLLTEENIGQYPKYINTASTSVVFKKGDILYNLFDAVKTKRNEVILCEGFMDCLSAKQALYTNCVASCGTALTEKQADSLKKSFKTVIVAYDSDEAGTAAFLRAKEMLEQRGLAVYKADLGKAEVKDFNELLTKKGEKGFSAFFKEQNIPIYEVTQTLCEKPISVKSAFAIANSMKEQGVPCRAMKSKTQMVFWCPEDKRNEIIKKIDEAAEAEKKSVAKKSYTL